MLLHDVKQSSYCPVVLLCCRHTGRLSFTYGIASAIEKCYFTYTLCLTLPCHRM